MKNASKKTLGILICLFVIIISVLAVVIGYFNKSANIDGTPVVVLTYSYWSDIEATPNEYTNEFIDLKKGEVIYEYAHYKLTVKKISEDAVVLCSSGGLIEQNPDGTINLNDKGPKTFTIPVNSEMKIASQSMDGGVSLTISYRIEEKE
ncbi:hypothetical protein [Butyrivibrio sp. INlla14]|uniref:hypothetical protein n=1 Tax=Butyrivibrio sp. INlla14 TaxID=1520808 RepID=UPI0008766E19|nr:hypothetical protein [Butyrivibrio sp. INlla14]SCX94903.1 hypothetical protein SAMN02910371_00483 [Butyrivibrio sp. INlla14]